MTSWRLPRPLNVDAATAGHTSFYLRRWSSDGLATSAKDLAVFEYEPLPAGDGDADAEADADADADVDADGDADADDTDGGESGCACRTSGGDGRGDVTVTVPRVCRRLPPSSSRAAAPAPHADTQPGPRRRRAAQLPA